MATKEEEGVEEKIDKDLWLVDSGFLLMATKEGERIEKKIDKDLWFLDSGCSNHMCCNRHWFSSFDGSFVETVRFGNCTRMAVKGQGTVKVKINGILQIIADVYYVPGLKNNLISIGQLQERGLKVVFEDNECKVYHKRKGLIITSIMTRNRVFLVTGHVISLDVSNESCHNIVDSDLSHLWHCRFGHLSHKVEDFVSKGDGERLTNASRANEDM